MSVTVADIDTTAVVVGTAKVITFPAPPAPIEQQMRPAALQQAQLHVYNESPVGWKCLFPQSNKTFNLPAGAWAAVYIPANETELDLTAVYVITAAVVNHLLADYYYANEPSDEISALGNSPVGTASAVANQLQATPSAITTGFAASQRIPNGGAVDPATLVLYVFGGPYPAGADLFICNIDNGGVARPWLENHGGGAGLTVYGQPTAGNFISVVDINSKGQLDQIAGQGTAANGVPIVVADQPGNTAITATTQQTILTFTPAVDGSYRCNAEATVNNGVSGNAILLQAKYTDAHSGAARVANFISNNGGTAVNVLANSASLANGTYPCLPVYFRAKGGTAITIVYLDPTNTPSDNVSATIEWLS